jgi:hypothetical protein
LHEKCSDARRATKVERSFCSTRSATPQLGTFRANPSGRCLAGPAAAAAPRQRRSAGGPHDRAPRPCFAPSTARAITCFVASLANSPAIRLRLASRISPRQAAPRPHGVLHQPARLAVSPCAIRRAAKSAPPPTPDVTMRTGLLGYAWPCATHAKSAIRQIAQFAEIKCGHAADSAPNPRLFGAYACIPDHRSQPCRFGFHRSRQFLG